MRMAFPRQSGYLHMNDADTSLESLLRQLEASFRGSTEAERCVLAGGPDLDEAMLLGTRTAILGLAAALIRTIVAADALCAGDPVDEYEAAPSRLGDVAAIASNAILRSFDEMGEVVPVCTFVFEQPADVLRAAQEFAYRTTDKADGAGDGT